MLLKCLCNSSHHGKPLKEWSEWVLWKKFGFKSQFNRAFIIHELITVVLQNNYSKKKLQMPKKCAALSKRTCDFTGKFLRTTNFQKNSDRLPLIQSRNHHIFCPRKSWFRVTNFCLLAYSLLYFLHVLYEIF